MARCGQLAAPCAELAARIERCCTARSLLPLRCPCLPQATAHRELLCPQGATATTERLEEPASQEVEGVSM